MYHSGPGVGLFGLLKQRVCNPFQTTFWISSKLGYSIIENSQKNDTALDAMSMALFESKGIFYLVVFAVWDILSTCLSKRHWVDLKLLQMTPLNWTV